MQQSLIHIILFFLLLSVQACQTSLTGTGLSGGDAALSTGGAQTAEVNAHANERPSSFAESTFSEFVYIDSTNQKLLLDWNFFPSTQYDSDAKTLTLPCDVEKETTTAEGVSYSESVPLGDASCTAGVVLDLGAATFEVYGLVFAFSGTLDVLESDFSILISAAGFKTTQGEAVTFESAEDVDLVAVVASL